MNCTVVECHLVAGFAARLVATRGSKKLMEQARTKTERRPLYIFGDGMMKCAKLNEQRGLVRLITVYEACVLTNFGFAVAQQFERWR